MSGVDQIMDSSENASVPASSALTVDAATGQLQQRAPISGDPSRSQAAVQALAASQLYRAADLSRLSFSTTAELEPIHGLIGQDRALGAINFSSRIDKAGFNLFVIGPNGARMQEAVKAVECRQTDRDRTSSLRLHRSSASPFQTDVSVGDPTSELCWHFGCVHGVAGATRRHNPRGLRRDRVRHYRVDSSRPGSNHRSCRGRQLMEQSCTAT